MATLLMTTPQTPHRYVHFPKTLYTYATVATLLTVADIQEQIEILKVSPGPSDLLIQDDKKG
jgi:hypothetical protein